MREYKVSKCPIPFNTGVTDIEERTAAIAHYMNTVRIYQTGTGLSLVSSDPALNEQIQKDHINEFTGDYFPVVVMVASAGGSGKDTFIELVDHVLTYDSASVSTVDAVKDAVDKMNDALFKKFRRIYELHMCPVYSAPDIRECKDDRYRSFLHNVKDAWSEFNEGPALYCLSEYLYHARFNIEAMNSTTRPCSVVFMNNRDKDTNELMKDWCKQLGIICINVKVEGRVRPSDYECECDRHVDFLNYDMVIENKGTLEELRIQAYMFARLLEQAIMKYGIEIPAGSYIADFTMLPEEKPHNTSSKLKVGPVLTDK